jgi:hypothetical protein
MGAVCIPGVCMFATCCYHRLWYSTYVLHWGPASTVVRCTCMSIQYMLGPLGPTRLAVKLVGPTTQCSMCSKRLTVGAGGPQALSMPHCFSF